MCGCFHFQYQGVLIRLTGKNSSRQPKDFLLPIGVDCRIGRLTIVAPTKKRKGGYTVWLCRCDCGGEITLDTRCLQRQTVTDCGCVSRVKPYSPTNFNTIKTDTKKASTTSKGVHTRFSFPYSHPISPKMNTLQGRCLQIRIPPQQFLIPRLIHGLLRIIRDELPYQPRDHLPSKTA